MKKPITVLCDFVIISITFFSLVITWQLVQTNLEPLFYKAGNFTQTSVTTTIPGSNLSYIFPALLIVGAFLNIRSVRYKMASVAVIGLLSMAYNQIA